MPGYQLSDADSARLDERYFCVLCKLLLRDAKQTSCGHLYCQSCLENLQQIYGTAPITCVVDQEESLRTPARLKDFKEHKIHLRRLACSYVEALVSQLVQSHEHLNTSMENKLIRLQRGSLRKPAFDDNFMRREVLALEVHCTFIEEGCRWRGLVRNLEEHIDREHNHVQFQKASQGQLRRLHDNVQQLDNHRVEMKRDLDEQKLEAILERNENLLRMTNLENKIAENSHNTSRDLANVKRQQQRTERRMESIEHTLALRNVDLADQEEYVRQQEFSSYDGQLLWNITEFARRRNEAVSGQQASFYSPCFFTSRYGYKMCARIYLNGDGMGRGTHISVFFVVMRGQYDALLRWPFRQKVTFMLLDQDNEEHVIDAFRPDPSSSSFQRPRREANIASGCPMFCSHDELHNHAYVRDDTMFLKVIVDTSHL